jgi:hypothetical protein
MLMVLLGFVGAETSGIQMFIIAGMGGALLGFLRFNFPPARIYLGDGGAYFLGFQIGLFAIVGSHKGEVLAALVSPLFVLALPILDTNLAILRRGLCGLPLFRPDRRHLHHHLLNAGLSQRGVVVFFYALTLVFLALGMAAYWSRGNWIPALFGIIVLILLLCASFFRFSRRWFAFWRMFGNSLNMRREIEYALCLSKWLSLEGARCGDIDTLWSTLEIVADKLGFSLVRLTLADGARVWIRPPRAGEDTGCSETNPPASPPRYYFRHRLMGGRCGVIELEAPQSGRYAEVQRAAMETGGRQRNWARPTITGEGLFETFGELLAEGWIKSAARFLEPGDAPLRFAIGKEPPSKVSSGRAPVSMGVRLAPPERSGL